MSSVPRLPWWRLLITAPGDALGRYWFQGLAVIVGMIAAFTLAYYFVNFQQRIAIHELFAPMTAIIGGFWFAARYLDDRQEEERRKLEALEAQREQRSFEARKPFLEEQLRLSMRAADIVATIATADDAAQRTQAEAEFWRHYHGSLAVVEDDGLSRAMVEFGRGLNERLGEEEMSRRALQVSYAARALIEKGWAVQIGTDTKDVTRAQRANPSS